MSTRTLRFHEHRVKYHLSPIPYADKIRTRSLNIHQTLIVKQYAVPTSKMRECVALVSGKKQRSTKFQQT